MDKAEKHTLLPSLLVAPEAFDRWCQACKPAYGRFLEECNSLSHEVAYQHYLAAIAPFSLRYHNELNGRQHD